MHSSGVKTNASAQKIVQLHDTSAQRAEEKKKQFGRALQQNKCRVKHRIAGGCLYFHDGRAGAGTLIQW
jgi:hypothetical protein